MGAYDSDLYAWAMEQAALLRAGRVGELDLEHLAEEIEAVGRSERRELVNRLAVLLAHLLKWSIQPGHRGASWALTIREQRRRLGFLLAENPSLQGRFAEVMGQGWELGCLMALRETGLERQAVPAPCPWTAVQVLDEAFLPE